GRRSPPLGNAWRFLLLGEHGTFAIRFPPVDAGSIESGTRRWRSRVRRTQGGPRQDGTPDAGSAGTRDAGSWTGLAASRNGPRAVRDPAVVPPHAGPVRRVVARIARPAAARPAVRGERPLH